MKNERLYSISIRLSLKCDSCSNMIPINEITDKLKCPKCQDIMETKGRFIWRELLNFQNPKIDVFSWAKKSSEGASEYDAWAPIDLNTVKEWPSCHKCQETITKEQIQAASESMELNCANCDSPQEFHKAPPLLTQYFPVVRYIVGAKVPQTQGDGKAIDINTSSKNPVMMACMACGGALRVDGKERLVECEFCQASNYLPDDLWLAMHPVPKREKWWAIYGSGRNSVV